jgi:hypothetical protein
MRGLWIIAVGGLAAFSSLALAAWALTPAPGHLPLHIGCTHHNHGPTRTAGEGKRLLDARALNRQARQPRD